MGFYSNVGNDEDANSTLEKQELSNSAREFDDALCSIRNVIGSFSNYFLSKALWCFDQKTTKFRKECGLYYILYNISKNSEMVSPALINLFFYICNKCSSEARPSLVLEWPNNFSLSHFEHGSESLEKEAFLTLSKKGKLAELDSCPFMGLVHRETYTFLDILNNCFSLDPWTDWDNAIKKEL